MKKLGLVGGTGPESTLVYYRELNRRIHERSGGKRFPELAVESVDLYKALGFVAEGDMRGWSSICRRPWRTWRPAAPV